MLKLRKIPPPPIYSFFAAGHTYGSSISPQYGLHPPFVDFISEVNSFPEMQLGFLTGDVVVASTADYWDAAQVDINEFNMPIHIAAGNHDIGEEFLNRFENYYYSFIHQNDLFIILTPGLDSWNISGDQLEFMINAIDSNYTQVNNVFIFLHELIWWSPNNEYQNIEINFEPYYPGSTNFESVIKPLLLSYPNNFVLYAGDLGCSNVVSPFMYHNFDNITLIGSGMGGGVEDNFIVTEVYQDSVNFNLVAINGDDPKALGELTDFELLNLKTDTDNHEIKIYPNPFNSQINISYFMTTKESVKLEVFDSVGKQVLILSRNGQIGQNHLIIKEDEIKNIHPGFYFLKISIDGIRRSFPIIKY